MLEMLEQDLIDKDRSRIILPTSSKRQYLEVKFRTEHPSVNGTLTNSPSYKLVNNPLGTKQPV